jgi:hypothetical protein
MLVPVTEEDIEDALLTYSPQLRKKIAAGLKDIRAGRTSSLADYLTKRAKRRFRGHDLPDFSIREGTAEP